MLVTILILASALFIVVAVRFWESARYLADSAAFFYQQSEIDRRDQSSVAPEMTKRRNLAA